MQAACPNNFTRTRTHNLRTRLRPQAILTEEERVVVIRFGHDWDKTCTAMDEVLFSLAEDVKNFAVVYLVDISEVPEFNTMYELYDPCTVMFFYRNKHIMIDLGTGNNNKINWCIDDRQEVIDIIETVYRGAKKVYLVLRACLRA